MGNSSKRVNFPITNLEDKGKFSLQCQLGLPLLPRPTQVSEARTPHPTPELDIISSVQVPRCCMTTDSSASGESSAPQELYIEVQAPEVPTPETPSPESRYSEAPSSEVPTPEAPSSEVPTPEAPSSEVPTPETPSSEVPTPEVPSSEVGISEVPDAVQTFDRNLQVRLKSDGERLLLLLPPEAEERDAAGELTWTELSQQLQHRLNGGERFWQPNTTVHLIAVDRLLDQRQLQEIAETLSREQLQLDRVSTCRRQTAVAAATAGYSVEQQSRQESLHQVAQNQAQALAEPLYLQTTVRSGVEIRHPGTIVIVGDVNPGGSVIADGDILVWGRLRGLAHAGAAGNSGCMIMALQMEPTQLRIAEAVARAPANPPSQYYPEVAYETPQGIRITRASDFSRTQMLLGSKPARRNS